MAAHFDKGQKSPEPWPWKYGDYSNWSKQLAETSTREELELGLQKVESELGCAVRSHLRAIERTHSMQSQSQHRAQSRNCVSGAGERKRAIKDAIEIHENFPDKAKKIRAVAMFAPRVSATRLPTITRADAEVMGAAAFANGIKPAPSLDPKLMASLGSEGNIEILTAWSKGWHQANIALDCDANELIYGHGAGANGSGDETMATTFDVRRRDILAGYMKSALTSIADGRTYPFEDAADYAKTVLGKVEAISKMTDAEFRVEFHLPAVEKSPTELSITRSGDFYEAYNDDAVTISRELDMALNHGSGNGLSMVGMPIHAIDKYVGALLLKGFTVLRHG